MLYIFGANLFSFTMFYLSYFCTENLLLVTRVAYNKFAHVLVINVAGILCFIVPGVLKHLDRRDRQIRTTSSLSVDIEFAAVPTRVTEELKSHNPNSGSSLDRINKSILLLRKYVA